VQVACDTLGQAVQPPLRKIMAYTVSSMDEGPCYPLPGTSETGTLDDMLTEAFVSFVASGDVLGVAREDVHVQRPTELSSPAVICVGESICYAIHSAPQVAGDSDL
jgi:hypothetical protein